MLVLVSESLRWAAGEAGWKSLEIRVTGNRIGRHAREGVRSK